MIVTTQKELDAAVAAGETGIIINSPAGVWLTVKGSSSVVAWDSSSVEARGSSSVVAWDSSSVVARDSSSVEARGSSSVVAWDSSSVVARGSSSVVAWGSSSVEARGSSRVVAWDSSSVVAGDSSSVEASKYVAVHLHSARATVTGGVVIDLTALDLTHITDWADYHGVEVVGDEVIVYKAVSSDLRSARGFAYPIGETVTCPDWDPTPACGGGLHLSPHPAQARDYYRAADRFLRCAVPVDALTIIDGEATRMTPKLKARTVKVLCEVDLHGNTINKEN
ncbi:hypothetical protein GKZ75_08415 [Kocuria indica]|uniref:DUF7666 domain-containing protein n=1 Tax=Kocuria marina subsp. indica TaxID=1049583 RepID=A0A6N9QYD5_9MICC|nr:hypothetical protein [Kocuria indica]NDO78245.1 hypothetical protein [Kocuria indica]